MKTLQVTCAMIVHKGKVLAAQRSSKMDLPGKWEFPGGKVEPNEDPKSCLVREIQEELNMEIDIFEELPPATHAYPTKTIRLIPFCASWKGGEIRLLEHEQIRWLEKNELLSLDWAPADLPIVHDLIENWVKLVISTEF